jgi:hypothetical protein
MGAGPRKTVRSRELMEQLMLVLRHGCGTSLRAWNVKESEENLRSV